jgi:hypothetical protein
MFDAPNYRRLGIYFTPDYWKTSANNPIWAIIGVKCRNEWEFETGQIFVDKKLHLDVFLLIRYMLERHDFVRNSSIICPRLKLTLALVVLLFRWRQRHFPMGDASPS